MAAEQPSAPAGASLLRDAAQHAARSDREICRRPARRRRVREGPAAGEPRSGAIYGGAGTPEGNAQVNAMLEGVLDAMFQLAPPA